MDSPDPGSPVSSSESGPDDLIYTPAPEPSLHHIGGTRGEPYPSSGKRRMPLGNTGSSAKSRRREEPARRATASSSAWMQTEYGGSGRSAKDELVDNQLVEKLRAGAFMLVTIPIFKLIGIEDWGDPFDQSLVRDSS